MPVNFVASNSAWKVLLTRSVTNDGPEELELCLSNGY